MSTIEEFMAGAWAAGQPKNTRPRCDYCGRIVEASELASLLLDGEELLVCIERTRCIDADERRMRS